MPSFDGIMIQEYYLGTSRIINPSLEIGKLLGIVDSNDLRKTETLLRTDTDIWKI